MHDRTIDRGKLRLAIEDAFTDLALYPDRAFHFISGPKLARRLGYHARLLSGVPPAAMASFAGVGNPWRGGRLPTGARVLDIGCGVGVDVLIASRLVGKHGVVLGVDMTSAMIERAEQYAVQSRAQNVRFAWGHAESLPVPDEDVSVVVSNGVFALTPNKLDAFRELFRVLRPGGEARISDVVTQWRLPEHVARITPLWTDCLAGATWISDYPPLLRAAGFVDVAVTEVFDVFSGTPIEDRSRMFGARGANIRAFKPARGSQNPTAVR